MLVSGEIWQSPDITWPVDCQGSMIVTGEYKNPRQSTVRKTVNPRILLAQWRSSVRQDLTIPRTLLALRKSLSGKSWKNPANRSSIDLRMNKSPELHNYTRLLESPELYRYWSLDELYWNEAPLGRTFLKILFENADENKKYLVAETLKTSNLSNKIVCRPPQSRETILLSPIQDLFIKYRCH